MAGAIISKICKKSAMAPIPIDNRTSLDDSELSFSFSRSGGPGGQNVNKVATKATVSLDLLSSPSFTADQRQLLAEVLSHRLTKEGVLKVSRQSSRSQGMNRKAAVEALVSLVQDALDIPAERRPTRPRRSVNERRITNKKHRSRIKEGRGRSYGPDD